MEQSQRSPKVVQEKKMKSDSLDAMPPFSPKTNKHDRAIIETFSPGDQRLKLRTYQISRRRKLSYISGLEGDDEMMSLDDTASSFSRIDSPVIPNQLPISNYNPLMELSSPTRNAAVKGSPDLSLFSISTSNDDSDEWEKHKIERKRNSAATGKPFTPTRIFRTKSTSPFSPIMKRNIFAYSSTSPKLANAQNQQQIRTIPRSPKSARIIDKHDGETQQQSINVLFDAVFKNEEDFGFFLDVLEKKTIISEDTASKFLELARKSLELPLDSFFQDKDLTPDNYRRLCAIRDKQEEIRSFLETKSEKLKAEEEENKRQEEEKPIDPNCSSSISFEKQELEESELKPLEVPELEQVGDENLVQSIEVEEKEGEKKDSIEVKDQNEEQQEVGKTSISPPLFNCSTSSLGQEQAQLIDVKSECEQEALNEQHPKSNENIIDSIPEQDDENNEMKNHLNLLQIEHDELKQELEKLGVGEREIESSIAFLSSKEETEKAQLEVPEKLVSEQKSEPILTQIQLMKKEATLSKEPNFSFEPDSIEYFKKPSEVNETSFKEIKLMMSKSKSSNILEQTGDKESSERKPEEATSLLDSIKSQNSQRRSLFDEFCHRMNQVAKNKKEEAQKELTTTAKQDQSDKELIDKLQAELEACKDRELKYMDQIDFVVSQNEQFQFIADEFEKIFKQFVVEKDTNEAKLHKEIIELTKERDHLQEDVVGIERSFDDLHRRFEKLKTKVIELKGNEDNLKIVIESYKQQLEREKLKYSTLKKHAEEKLDVANVEIEKLRKNTGIEIQTLKAELKRSEIKINSMELNIQQKDQENSQLTNLLEDLLNKVKPNNGIF